LALLAGAPALAEAAEPHIFRIAAADGQPAAFRVPYAMPQAGRLQVVARWEGRGLAGLRVESASGDTLIRRTGPSPLRVEVDATASRALVVRFATFVDSGSVAGTLALFGPAVSPDGRTPEVLEGGATCLGPAVGPDRVGQALGAFDRRLAGAPLDERRWLRGWAEELAALAGREGPDGALVRHDLDRLWSRLKFEARSGRRDEAVVRRLLSALEALALREEEAVGSERGELRARRRAILEALSCLPSMVDGRM
jgi:hypothetical protein